MLLFVWAVVVVVVVVVTVVVLGALVTGTLFVAGGKIKNIPKLLDGLIHKSTCFFYSIMSLVCCMFCCAVVQLI